MSDPVMVAPSSLQKCDTHLQTESGSRECRWNHDIGMLFVGSQKGYNQMLKLPGAVLMAMAWAFAEICLRTG